MRKRVSRWLAVFVALFALTLTFSGGLADAGDFSGDTDWGGDSWDFGSDWDSDSDSSWDLWGSDSDSDDDSFESSWGPVGGTTFWDSGTTSGSGNMLTDERDDEGGGSAFLGLIVVLIIVFVLLRMRKNKPSGAQVYTPTTNVDTQSLAQLKNKDPKFSEEEITERIRNDYVRMQQAWEKRDFEPMRAVMTDALYNQMATQLAGLKSKGWTNRIERIAVLDARLTRYFVEGDNDVLIARVKTRITDYTVNDKTGEIVKGSQTKELFMTYDWKLIRPKDQLTSDKAEMKTVSCPHCGAPLSVNESTRCQYCGTVITLSEHDWALSAIKGISQVSGS